MSAVVNGKVVVGKLRVKILQSKSCHGELDKRAVQAVGLLQPFNQVQIG
jgi:hypothetical protein